MQVLESKLPEPLIENVQPPPLVEVRRMAALLSPYIDRTPVHRLAPNVRRDVGADLWLKLELMQRTGSFKPRGALAVALSLPRSRIERGFTAFSSGNHAAAVSYAASILGTTAKVVMLPTANPARRENCLRFGAEIVFAEDGAHAAQLAADIAAAEGRTIIHPYEGLHTSAGTATLALELVEQIPDLDSVVIAVGGGGLCSGVAAAMKQLLPACEIFAVEPAGADTMYRSFRSGRCETLQQSRTMADSLAPPRTFPYSASLCRRFVDDLVLIEDAEIRAAMAFLYREAKLVTEPGGAAATAGALFALRERLAGKRVALVVCGANIDAATFAQQLKLPAD